MKQQKLKIGLVLDDTLDSTDGVQQYVLTLAECLSKQGHEVHFLVGHTKRTDKPNIHSLSKNIAVRFNKNKLSVPLPASQKKTRQLLNRLQLDIIHVQMPFSPFLAGRVIASASEQTAVVGTFHILPASNVARFGTHFLGKLTKRSLARFDEFCAVSKPAQKFMLQAFGEKARVIPNAVNLRYFSGTKPKVDQDLRIVFLGRLVERKGAQYAIRAFARLNNKNTALLIGGSGPMQTKLQKLVRRLDVTDRVEFLGRVAEASKADLLASADIAVFPSLGGESFGIVLVEAIAAGAGVVIAGDNPGYASVITDLNQRVDPKDVSIFATKLDDLLANKKLRQNIHKSQQKLITKYDVDAVGRQVLTMYTDALRKRSNSR